MSEETLFHEALAQPPAERAAFLDKVCAGQPQLRAAVAALLAAHEASGAFLNKPPAELGQTVDSDPAQPPPAPPHLGPIADHQPPIEPGTVIAGRYKLLEQIGEGGMGTVWVAEQTQPVRRKVALKLIKAGMDSKSVLARFEAERQALAVMDHPNIAKVLDGGLTEAGRPFFVMEYVKGVPITDYCEAARLSIPARLQLFAQVCQAVQHAHQKGIIHRDLKPSNILVAPYDDKPVPKVIDFGLAKAMHQSLTERTLHTAHETVLGTPLYMSPEQAQLNNLDVDTRSDIYSLGVLLYELLTGSTPLEKQRFKAAAWDEIRWIIREEEPPRPSTRLSSANTLAALAAGRQTEPARLTKLVRGELDWIVMKALEKDRTRRYETANGFAADVLRYLAGEPVLAAPPSARYRLRKFARKHRTALTTAAALALLLLAGVAVSTWQAVRATHAESAARNAEQEALQAQRAATERAEGERRAKVDAQAQKAKAEAARDNEARERGYAEAIAQFVKDDFLALTSVEGQGRFGGEALTRNATLRELLDRAAEKLKKRKQLAPRTEAELCWIIGVSYRGVGEFARALPFLERSVALHRQASGTQAEATLNAQNSLAVAYLAAGQFKRAESLQEETLKLRKAKLGSHHPLTLQSMNNLAGAYQALGKLALGLPLYEETLKLSKAKLGPEHPSTLATMNNLAVAYQTAGKLDVALPLFEQTLQLRKARLGPDHPHTLNSMNHLAGAYQAAGKLALGLPLFEETLKLRKAKLGPDHPATLITMNNLALAYRTAGKLDLALPLFEETLKLCKARLGPDHPHTLISMGNFALAYRAAGKLDLALPLFEETLKLRKAKLAPEHPHTLLSMNNLAAAYWAAKQLDKSIPLFEETLKRREAKLGRDHPDTLMVGADLGVNYQDAGRLKEAIPLLEEAYRAAKKYPALRWVSMPLLAAYAKAGENAKFAGLLREHLPAARRALPRNSPQLAGMLAQISLGLLEKRKWAEVEPLLRECLAIRQKTQPDDWSTFNTKSMLGGALLGQKKYADAEPLLLAGYAGMKQREKTIPPQGKLRLTEAVQRLVQRYEATGRKDDAAKWRTELKSRKEAAKKPVQP